MSCRARPRDRGHGGRLGDRPVRADEGRCPALRRGAAALHRGDQRRRPRCQGGGRDGDRRHGLPRCGQGMVVQLACARPLDPTASASSRTTGPSTPSSSRTGCDAALLVGMHARAGTGRACSTTPSSGRDYQNLASTAARRGGRDPRGPLRDVGCPVLLVTGDEAVCNEGRELLGNGLTTVAVKRGTGAASARQTPPVRARELIEEGARKSARGTSRRCAPGIRGDRARSRSSSRRARGRRAAVQARCRTASTTARSPSPHHPGGRPGRPSISSRRDRPQPAPGGRGRAEAGCGRARVRARVARSGAAVQVFEAHDVVEVRGRDLEDGRVLDRSDAVNGARGGTGTRHRR